MVDAGDMLVNVYQSLLGKLEPLADQLVVKLYR